MVRRAQDFPTHETAEAAQFGDKVSAEKSDLTPEQAESVLDELLKPRPRQ